MTSTEILARKLYNVYYEGNNGIGYNGYRMVDWDYLKHYPKELKIWIDIAEKALIETIYRVKNI